jgi:SAM-dependent methyltransferase
MSDPLAFLDDIMRRNGATCSPAEFHAAVNTTFHRYESEVYDDLHSDMWQSLPRQVDLLAQDCLRSPELVPREIRMLDIGCGTGLATDALLRTPLGERVIEIDLVDTSKAMMAHAQNRRKLWGRPGMAFEGLVEDLPPKHYDLIITSSVLHHVPDLASFLRAVTNLQKTAHGHALFLHMQDPNGDAFNDPEKLARAAEFPRSKMPEWFNRLAPKRVWGRLTRELSGQQGQDYLSKANRELVRLGIVKTPLRTADMFAITDVHVHDGQGVSIGKLKDWLSSYDLVSSRSYGFFGELWSSLPANLRVREEQLTQSKAQNGEFLSAAWRMRG